MMPDYSVRAKRGAKLPDEPVGPDDGLDLVRGVVNGGLISLPLWGALALWFWWG